MSGKSEFLGELKTLKQVNLNQDGTPKQDAVPQELARIAEITAMLGGTPAEKPKTSSNTKATIIAELEGLGLTVDVTTSYNDLRKQLKVAKDAGPIAKPVATPAKESESDELKRLKRENKALKSKNSRGRDAAKIQRSEGQHSTKHVKRADEVMGEALEDAEEREPANWDESNRVAVEREIRKYVRQGGSRKNTKGDWYDLPAGFKKGLSLQAKKYALDLLEKMDRLSKPLLADDIYAMIKNREETMKSAKLRQTNTAFNGELEGMGVAWDDSIQVPGWSKVV